MEKEVKIGVVPCSGEECLGGMISRLVTRKMIDELRPEETVTMCLPLIFSGSQEEKMFAKEFPTITVDGCSKACAKRTTEKYSGRVRGAIRVSDIIGTDSAESRAVSGRDLTDKHRAMVDKVVAEVLSKFDEILTEAKVKNSSCKSSSCSCGCSCS